MTKAWAIFAVTIAILVLLPVVSVLFIAAYPEEPVFMHLLQTVLPTYIANSLLLMIGVAILSGMIGTGAAWLVVMFEFPLRRQVQWLLVLPLAIPAYIGAYALVDFFEYAGPLQTGLRALFGWHSAKDYYFPEIRSIGAAILVFSFTLYPYVYLLARATFKQQSSTLFEVSRTLGKTPTQSFFKVALPLARPAITAGLAIVMMECLSDFGTVDFFAVQTLTKAVFSSWLQAHNAGAAAQIATIILVFVALLALLEKYSRRSQRYFETSKHLTEPEAFKTSKRLGGVLTLLCFIPFLLGFLFPLLVLSRHTFFEQEIWFDQKLWRAAGNSILLGGVTVFTTLIPAIIMVYAVRISQNRFVRLFLPVTLLGYAVPGAVLAIGILLSITRAENLFADLVLNLTGYDPGLFFTGTIMALVYAFSVRFFALAQGAIDAGFSRIPPNLSLAARSLGRSSKQTLLEIDLPLMKTTLVTAGLLVFVDTLKELPATLVLRPFNFDTVSTRVYEFASLEDIAGASAPALLIVAIGILPIAILIGKSR